jgi:hypothetical protein
MSHRGPILAAACALATAGCGAAHHAAHTSTAASPPAPPAHHGRCPDKTTVDALVPGGRPWRAADAIPLRQRVYRFECAYGGQNAARLVLVFGRQVHPHTYRRVSAAAIADFQRANGAGFVSRHGNSFAISANGAREVVAGAVNGRVMCLVPNHFGASTLGLGDIDDVERFVRRACGLR